jgi:periplasmic protein TonB
MSVLSLSGSSPWSIGHEEDRRFYLILSQTVAATLLLSTAIRYIPIPHPDTETEQEPPPRYVRLLTEPLRPTSRPPSQAASKESSPATSPEPGRQKPMAAAAPPREKVSSIGVLAMGDALARLQLRSTGSDSRPGQELPETGRSPDPVQNYQLTENLSEGSGGFDGGVGHQAVLGEADWPQRDESRQTSAGTVTRAATPGDTIEAPRGRGRTQEEIQERLDRNKGAMYTLYNRALRDNAGLQGELVLRVSIAPAGNVTRCVIISSELGADSLERQLVALITGINFGNKPGAGPVTTNIPIEFFPQ